MASSRLRKRFFFLAKAFQRRQGLLSLPEVIQTVHL
jgi:hypothetical protein